MSCISLVNNNNNWGEPERAQHRRVERSRSIYIYIIIIIICMVRPSRANRRRHCTALRGIFKKNRTVYVPRSPANFDPTLTLLEPQTTTQNLFVARARDVISIAAQASREVVCIRNIPNQVYLIYQYIKSMELVVISNTVYVYVFREKNIYN